MKYALPTSQIVNELMLAHRCLCIQTTVYNAVTLCYRPVAKHCTRVPWRRFPGLLRPQSIIAGIVKMIGKVLTVMKMFTLLFLRSYMVVEIFVVPIYLHPIENIGSYCVHHLNIHL